MVHQRPALPQGHGEVLTHPAFDTWEATARDAHDDLGSQTVSIGGVPLARLRVVARREAVARAQAFSARFGLESANLPIDPDLLVLTGHQPELFHPGVWVKQFLVDWFMDQPSAIGIDLVVDTDLAEGAALVVPCLDPDATRCAVPLSADSDETLPYCLTAVPEGWRLERFCEEGDAALSTLPAPALRRHFARFCDALSRSIGEARNLGELITFARRRFESPAGTSYLELPVSELAQAPAFRRFTAHLLADAERFACVHNSELHAYRVASGTRSNAQPFPDLAGEAGEWEAPFWLLDEQGRHPVYVGLDDERLTLRTAERTVFECRADVDSIMGELERSPILAPRALTLTMYARLIIADLFIHGVGGGRYDEVTDAVIRSYLGVEPPPFAVASMTMYLPLGRHLVTEEEVAELRQSLHRLEHNPDAMLGEVEFDTGEERAEALALADEKQQLVSAIQKPDADKKALGLRIREVNEQLGAMLEPLRDQMRTELESAEHHLSEREVLTDRTYPFCLWSPIEVQDKVR